MNTNASKPPGRPLRVLFVEDSEPDCELLMHELGRQGFAVGHRRVETAEAMRAALDEAGWDLVLADFHLPCFSGVEALQLLHGRGLDLPFILVSGSMEDGAVIEAMRSGAHDYIGKMDLTRLGPAVERELREAGVRQELRRALQDVREGAERLKLAASASNTGLWDWNLATNEMFFSAEWKAQLGYRHDELPSVFAEWEQRLHPEDRAATMAKVQAHVANPAVRYEAEARLRHRDGTWRWIRSVGQAFPDAEGRPGRMLGSHQDITERKRFEAEYLRAQRVESIGTLAGGVAHDLNNILTPILMSGELLRDEVAGEDARVLLTTMETCARRGSDLVKQLLTFARGGDGQRVLLQPRHLLREVVALLPTLLPKTCKIGTSFPAALWAMEGDATQFHQVVLNLCVNARDAMPHGGDLSLVASNAQIDEAFAAMQPGARPGPHVCLKVTDTGTGIPAENLEKIFEPFFTTKESGRGTGLGLATVLSIVRSHGGFVQVQSKMGSGTEFRVFFPAKPGLEAVGPDPGAESVPTGAGETVLVVDDEGPLREVVRRTLETHGYTVLAAGDGTEGLATFLEHRHDVRVVVTDVTMPFLDGVGMVRSIRRIDQDVRIIASSGLDLKDGADGPRRELAALGVASFLQKPYHAETLLRLVHKILASAGARRVAERPPGGAAAAQKRPAQCDPGAVAWSPGFSQLPAVSRSVTEAPARR